MGATLYVTCKAVLAIGLWGMASIGYLQGPLAWWERLVAFAAGPAWSWPCRSATSWASSSARW